MFCYSRVAPQQNKISGNRKKTFPGLSILQTIAAKSPILCLLWMALEKTLNNALSRNCNFAYASTTTWRWDIDEGTNGDGRKLQSPIERRGGNGWYFKKEQELICGTYQALQKKKQHLSEGHEVSHWKKTCYIPLCCWLIGISTKWGFHSPYNQGIPRVVFVHCSNK